jgi:hypothetical protein
VPTPRLTHDPDRISAFLDRVTPERRKADAYELDALFRAATGWRPCLWPTGILGYGSYDYAYDSGYSGVWLATGFAPRKAKLVVYIMPGYAEFGDILARLGPHKTGKACLYLGALSKVDLTVLRELIRAGLEDLQTRWPVSPS